MKNLATVFFGAILILLGMSILFDTFHIFNFAGYALKLWPLIFVIWGLRILYRGHFYGGFLLVALGLLLTISNFNILSFNIFIAFWPILIILLGLNVIMNAFRNNTNKSSSSDYDILEKDKQFDEVNVFGDKKIKFNNTIGHGSVVTVFGSTNIDTTGAKTDKNKSVIEIVSVFGETTIIVPENIDIKLDSVPILGGIEDQRKSNTAAKAEGTLIIKAVAVLGSVNIR